MFYDNFKTKTKSREKGKNKVRKSLLAPGVYFQGSTPIRKIVLSPKVKQPNNPKPLPRRLPKWWFLSIFKNKAQFWCIVFYWAAREILW